MSLLNVYVVVDLGFGDSGKGTCTDALVRRYDASLVVRYNGGPQASHSVVTDEGIQHSFSQIGSGCLVPKTYTLLSAAMLVNPLSLVKEAEVLVEKGVPDALNRVFFDARCIIVTPYHRAVNRLRELARGKARHGSCFTGETKVRLLNGTEKTFLELVDHYGNGEPFWVYAATPDGLVKPARARLPRKTGYQVKIVRVTLDNGQQIKCTPDHLFMLRDGSYRAASTLLPGDSLMPLYTRKSLLYRERAARYLGSKARKYEQVYLPSTAEWVFTHRLVHPDCRSGNVRHHKDLNRFNNDPDNIVEMKWLDHRILHQKLGVTGGASWMRDPKNKAKIRAFCAGNGQRGKRYLIAYNKSIKGRLKSAQIGKVSGPVNMPAYNKSAAGREKSSIIGKIIGKLNLIAWNRSDRSANVGNHKRYGHKGSVESCVICRPNNHKVLAVEPAGVDDVYDITVDNYHNFALSAGVFVHNCGAGVGETMSDMLERPKGELRLMDLHDLRKFAKKLYDCRERMQKKASAIKNLPDVPQTAKQLSTFSYDIDALFDKYRDFYLSTRARILDEYSVSSFMSRQSAIVFEGAQGVLLDENYGFHPHTTWSNTTTRNAKILLEEAEILERPTTIGIIRSYMTRHGDGPFPSEDKDMTRLLEDPNNPPNAWQGAIRSGYLDLPLIQYALKVNGPVDCLAVTHMDKVVDPWPIVYAYACDHSFLRPHTTLEAQEKMGKELAKVGTCIYKSKREQFLKWLADMMETPIGITSYGPAYRDKRFHSLLAPA